MSYLEEFQHLIDRQESTPFLRLWEEYCLADSIEGKELVEILDLIRNSPFSSLFGRYAESVLNLWKQLEDEKTREETLRLLLDLQTTNSPILADLAVEYLTKKHKEQKYFNEKLRIVGLRGRHSFPSAIRNFELLTHMDKGSFVFHTGGWGVGEILEISILREHVLIEFEGIATPKELSFDNAFKNLLPLPAEHFLSRRFGNPDQLEMEGKKDPLFLIHLLLGDLGPKTAVEIKDELCELVIPEKDWAKWWQSARAKIKKDTKIQSPKSGKRPFSVRKEDVSHDQRFEEALRAVKSREGLILTTYNFMRDFPEVFKNPPLKDSLKTRLISALEETGAARERDEAHKIQLSFLLEDIFPKEFSKQAAERLQSLEKIQEVLEQVEIVSFRKRILLTIRGHREDWSTHFLLLLFVIEPNSLRDFIFKELQGEEKTAVLLKEKIGNLLHKVTVYPEAFFWYFQKLVSGEKVPYDDAESKRQFLEAFLILLHYIEDDPMKRELTKKIHNLILAHRYGMIRKFIEGASVEYLEEFLLLASKCHTLTKHDRKILQSLAQVVQPSMGAKTKEKTSEEEVIWTTPEGYQKLQEKLHRIGTVETVDNAREIEAARALGDLRENAEYKFALERRARLQSELKTLSQQLNKSRILTKGDISTEIVSVGVTVELLNSEGKKIRYTLLGPWDADPDNRILSFQSKLAQAMIGHKKGDEFDFQGEHYRVQEIKSYLEDRH